MTLALFEDDLWSNFGPIGSTRHLSQQLLGSTTIFGHVRRAARDADLVLLGRRYLAAFEKKRTGTRYNSLEEAMTIVNSRVNPLVGLSKAVRLAPGKAIMAGREVVAASIGPSDLKKVQGNDGVLDSGKLALVCKSLERLEAEGQPLFHHPWDILEANGEAIRSSAGKRRTAILEEGSIVEEFVSFDTSDGPVIVDRGARVESFSRLSGPCYVGKESVLHSGLVRPGTTIGDGCRVGGEVDQSIVYGHTNKAHFGYLGHSIVGEWVNIGAGAVTSDLKNTYGSVKMRVSGKRVDTGLVKLGAFIGDMAKVSIGTLIYGGHTIGVAARASGLVDDDLPDFTDSSKGVTSRLELERVLTTHERMKSRRNQTLSAEERAVVSHVYSTSH